MPLNIKDENVHDQARRLARLTGESITAAVRGAVAEKLAAVEAGRAPEPPRTPERLLALARDCAATLRNGGHSADHADLYGEDGLPR